MDGLELTTVLLRWIHIGAVIVAIGGVVFKRAVLIPAAEEVLDEGARDRLREAVRVRLARIVHASIGLLLLTGFGNFFLLAIRPRIEPMPYHAIFGPKLLLAFVIFFIASALVGKAEGFAGMRRASKKWLAVIAGLAAIIVLLSTILNQVRSAAGNKPTGETSALATEGS